MRSEAGCNSPRPREVGHGVDQAIDLLVGVRRGQLHPEAYLGLGHQRVGGERDVHAAREQLPPHLVDAGGVTQRHLDDREPRAVGGMDIQLPQRLQHPGCVVVQNAAQHVAAALIDIEAGQHRRQ